MANFSKEIGYFGLGVLALLLLRKVRTSPNVSPQLRLVFGRDLINLIQDTAQIYGMPANVVGAIVMVESVGNARAVGGIGERGLMQLTPGALSDVNAFLGGSFSMDQMFDPVRNLAAGTNYLKLQLQRSKGDWNLAIRAYNCGYTGASKNPNCGLAYLAKVKLWL